MRSGSAGLCAGAAILLAGFSSCCCGDGPTLEVRGGDVSVTAPRRDPPALRVLLFGDFGEATCQQASVAAAMEAANAEHAFDAAVSLGDNVYSCGPDTELPGARDCSFEDGNRVVPSYAPPRDVRFAVAHELPLSGLRRRDGAPVPTFVALGNHDVRATDHCAIPGRSRAETERTRACLEVARRAPHWTMPGRHYVIDLAYARIVVLDSNLLVEPYGGFDVEAELAFAREALRDCGPSVPCFVALHHPPVSAGVHGPPDPIAQPHWPVLREVARGKVAAWLGAHDHDLEHLRLDDGADVFVSGNACRGRETDFSRPLPDAELVWASTRWGFAWLEAWADGGWGIRFRDARGEDRHCCLAAPGASRCVPTECVD